MENFFTSNLHFQPHKQILLSKNYDSNSADIIKNYIFKTKKQLHRREKYCLCAEDCLLTSYIVVY